MSEQTTFVTPKRAAEKMARALAIPGVAERSAQVQAEMAQADRVHAESLAEIRNRRPDASRAGHADGVPQAVVSCLERQHDMLLSTLTGHLKAAGDRAESS